MSAEPLPMPPSTPDDPFPTPWEGGPTVFPAAAPLPAPGSTLRQPWTNPADIVTVQLSGCCGALPGDVCDCASWMAETYAAFDAPIRLPFHAGLAPATDPALAVGQ